MKLVTTTDGIGRLDDSLWRHFDVHGLVDVDRPLDPARLRSEIRAREHANGALSIPFDTQHAFLACGAQQIDDRREAVLPLVESLDRLTKELLGLSNVHWPARRRCSADDRLLHSANPILHRHRR